MHTDKVLVPKTIYFGEKKNVYILLVTCIMITELSRYMK